MLIIKLLCVAGEIERCLKKVAEGVETFEEIWKKVSYCVYVSKAVNRLLENILFTFFLARLLSYLAKVPIPKKYLCNAQCHAH